MILFDYLGLHLTWILCCVNALVLIGIFFTIIDVYELYVHILFHSCTYMFILMSSTY